MIELARHIEILLLSNDCVIVPDLGGFMAHHVDSRYDDKEALFLPPLRTIGFNPQLKMNDSLLVQSYIEAYDISYPEALARIEDEVNEVKQHLEHDGSYEFCDIGVLVLNENGNLEFNPCEAGILTPELYGLSSFNMFSLDKLFVEEVEANKKELLAATEPEETKSATILPFPDEDDDEKEERTIEVRVSLLRNIAAACIIIVCFLLFSKPLSDGGSSHLLKSKIDTGILTRIMPKDITSEKDFSKDLVAGKDANKASETKAAEEEKEVEAPKVEGHYTIVLASRVPKANAEDFVKELKKRGLSDSRVLDKPNSSTKVVFGSYSNEGEARKALSKYSDNSEFSDAWILKFN